jgi:hypothetical protein
MGVLQMAGNNICTNILAKGLINKSFSAIGPNIAPIAQAIDLASPEEPGQAADGVFWLKDGSLLIASVESEVGSNSFIKYGTYLYGTLIDLENKSITPKDVIMLVIFTGDVVDPPAPHVLTASSITPTYAFLGNFDGYQVIDDAEKKLGSGMPLDDEELLRLIFSPLMGTKGKRLDILERGIEVAKKIEDDDTQSFVAAGLAVVSKKFIKGRFRAEIKEWLSMTSLAKVYQDELDALSSLLDEANSEVKDLTKEYLTKAKEALEVKKLKLAAELRSAELELQMIDMKAEMEFYMSMPL